VSEYREVVHRRRSLVSVGRPRDDETICPDFLTPDIVVTKVRLRNQEHSFLDDLSLAKVDGTFRIDSKVWHAI
jgi:hypothetical protein